MAHETKNENKEGKRTITAIDEGREFPVERKVKHGRANGVVFK